MLKRYESNGFRNVVLMLTENVCDNIILILF